MTSLALSAPRGSGLPTYEDLQRRIEAQAEEIAWLRGELALDIEASRVIAAARAFGLPPQAAKLLLILRARHGRPARHTFLSDQLASAAATAETIIKVQTCRIRKQLGRDAIVTHWGVGISLSDAAAALVDQVLGELAR